MKEEMKVKSRKESAQKITEEIRKQLQKADEDMLAFFLVIEKFLSLFEDFSFQNIKETKRAFQKKNISISYHDLEKYFFSKLSREKEKELKKIREEIDEKFAATGSSIVENIHNMTQRIGIAQIPREYFSFLIQESQTGYQYVEKEEKERFYINSESERGFQQLSEILEKLNEITDLQREDFLWNVEELEPFYFLFVINTKYSKKDTIFDCIVPLFSSVDKDKDNDVIKTGDIYLRFSFLWDLLFTDFLEQFVNVNIIRDVAETEEQRKSLQEWEKYVFSSSIYNLKSCINKLRQKQQQIKTNILESSQKCALSLEVRTGYKNKISALARERGVPVSEIDENITSDRKIINRENFLRTKKLIEKVTELKFKSDAAVWQTKESIFNSKLACVSSFIKNSGFLSNDSSSREFAFKIQSDCPQGHLFYFLFEKWIENRTTKPIRVLRNETDFTNFLREIRKNNLKTSDFYLLLESQKNGEKFYQIVPYFIKIFVE